LTKAKWCGGPASLKAWIYGLQTSSLFPNRTVKNLLFEATEIQVSYLDLGYLFYREKFINVREEEDRRRRLMGLI
jgi:hypothetical protein